MPNARQSTANFKGDHLSIKMFGDAKPSGVVGDGTDDKPALDAAFSWFAAHGGGVLLFPVGTYLCEGTLNFPNTSLVLEGQPGAHQQQAILQFTHTTNTDCIYIGVDIRTDEAISAIRNLRILGRAEQRHGVNVHGPIASVLLENIEILDVGGDGLHMDHAYICQVAHPYIRRCGGNGIDLADCNEIRVQHGRINYCQWAIHQHGGVGNHFDCDMAANYAGGIWVEEGSDNFFTGYFEPGDIEVSQKLAKFDRATAHNTCTVTVGGPFQGVEDAGLGNLYHQDPFSIYNGSPYSAGFTNSFPDSGFKLSAGAFWAPSDGVSTISVEPGGVASGKAVRFSAAAAGMVRGLDTSSYGPMIDGEVVYVRGMVRANRPLKFDSATSTAFQLTLENCTTAYPDREVWPYIDTEWRPISLLALKNGTDAYDAIPLIISWRIVNAAPGDWIEIADPMVVKNPPRLGVDPAWLPYVETYDGPRTYNPIEPYFRQLRIHGIPAPSEDHLQILDGSSGLPRFRISPGFGTFTEQLFLQGASPDLFQINTDAGADTGIWRWHLDTDGTLRLQSLDDTYGYAPTILEFHRTGYAPAYVNVPGYLRLGATRHGALYIDADGNVASVTGVAGQVLTAHGRDDDPTFETLTPADFGAVGSNAPITPGTATKITYDAQGLVTAGAAADLGTADVTGTLDDARLPDKITPGTYTKLTVDAKGRATAATLLGASDIPGILGTTIFRASGGAPLEIDATGLANGAEPGIMQIWASPAADPTTYVQLGGFYAGFVAGVKSFLGIFTGGIDFKINVGGGGTSKFDAFGNLDIPGTYKKGGVALAAADVGALGATAAAGGDLSGNYPNPTVAKLQGRTVDSTAPSTNDALTWDGAKWTHTAPPVTSVAGKTGAVTLTASDAGAVAAGGAGKVDVTGRTGSTSGNVRTPGGATLPAGLYRLSTYILTTSAGSSGTAVLSVTFNDGVNSRTYTVGTTDLSTTAPTAFTPAFTSSFYTSGSGDVTYSVTVSGGGLAQYAFHIVASPAF